ncbi:MAG TPA: OmpH family outer membrane protein [Oceanospirillales bacterium]|nr:OmpH family outer membrane protein [Oceanospirillales bacterium]
MIMNLMIQNEFNLHLVILSDSIVCMNPIYDHFKRQKVILALLLFFSSGIYAIEKIGFVDMETLINNSPQINNARATISSEFEMQYADIEQKESDLEILENRITKDGAIMSLSELGGLQERARILERQLRRAKEDLKDAISIRNNQILKNIQDELKTIVKQYAIEHDYDAILINAILYVSDEMDITQEILQVLKEKSGNNEN